MKKLFFIFTLIMSAVSILNSQQPNEEPTDMLPGKIVNLLNKMDNDPSVKRLTEAEYNTLATFFNNEENRNKLVYDENTTEEQAREHGVARRNFSMHFEPLLWKTFNKISDEKSLKDLPAAEYNFFLTLLTHGVGLLHEQMPKEEGGRSQKVWELLAQNILNKINTNQSLQQTTLPERNLLVGLLIGPKAPEPIQKLTQSALPILAKNKEQLIKESVMWDFILDQNNN